MPSCKGDQHRGGLNQLTTEYVPDSICIWCKEDWEAKAKQNKSYQKGVWFPLGPTENQIPLSEPHWPLKNILLEEKSLIFYFKESGFEEKCLQFWGIKHSGVSLLLLQLNVSGTCLLVEVTPFKAFS